jgi:hypothetical protein
MLQNICSVNNSLYLRAKLLYFLFTHSTLSLQKSVILFMIIYKLFYNNCYQIKLTESCKRLAHSQRMVRGLFSERPISYSVWKSLSLNKH